MEKITLVRRLGSMFIDYLILCAILGLVGISISIVAFLLKRYFNIDLIWVNKWIVTIIILVVGFNKDYFRGKSIGKRAFGLAVMKNSKGTATKLQCFIRNLTFVLAPVEVFILLFSRQRRLGDLLAGTKVEISNKEVISSIVDEIKSELKKKTNA
jgi:uncharacterized RDD family membrane protein YckC